MKGLTDATERPERQQGRGDRALHGSIRVGHWRGVEIKAHWTVFVTVGLFATALATGTLPQGHPGDSRTAYWLVAVGTALVLFLALLAHEVAHAVVARGQGMEVKRVTLWLLGGVTELGGQSPSARADALVALAGPLTSLALGVVTAVVATWVGTSGLVGTALVWLASINILLAVFNLLPAAPLDGGRVLRALLWWRSGDRDRAADRAARAGRVFGYVLIGLGVLDAFSGMAEGWWLVLVGWFILSGAKAEQAAAADHHLAGLSAGEVMTEVPAAAPGWWTVEQLVAHLSPARVAVGVFPVVDIAGHTVGVCTMADLDVVPAAHRADTKLGTLAARHAYVVVPPDAPAAEVAAQIRAGGGVAVVEDANRPVGVVTTVELGRAAHLSLLGWQTAPHTA
ncbi:MAG: site-2 protease family protein [Nocardioides sp.]